MKRFERALPRWNGPLFFGLIAALGVSHCSEDAPFQPDQGVVPQLTVLIAPTVLFNRSEAAHIISVTVVDPQGLEDIQDVGFEIVKKGASQASTQGELFDDASHGDVTFRDDKHGIMAHHPQFLLAKQAFRFLCQRTNYHNIL